MYKMTRGVFLVSQKLKQKHFYKKHRRLIRLAVFLLLFFIAVRGFEKQISNFSKNYFPAFARQETTKCVGIAVEEVLKNKGFEYADFVTVRYTGNKVSSIETNAAAINSFKTEIVASAENKIERIRNSVMHIPLGAFTGLSLIANYGPKVPLSYCLTGSFSAELVSSFESAGINQTIHHIRLIVTSEIVTASVDYDDTLTFSSDYEIAQSVIVGEIPTTYGGYLTAVR